MFRILSIAGILAFITLNSFSRQRAILLKNKNNTLADSDTLRVPVKVIFTPDYVNNQPKEDTVFFSIGRPLMWSDFTGNKNWQSPSVALTYSSYAYDGFSKLINDTMVIKLTMQVFFVKSESWVSSSAKSDYALRHEQLHFDITKISEERFKQRVLNAKLSPTYHDSELYLMFLDSFGPMDSLQEAYDHATGHGTDKIAQHEWDHKIIKELNNLLNKDY